MARVRIRHPRLPAGVELEEPFIGDPMIFVDGAPAPRDARDPSTFLVSAEDGSVTRVQIGRRPLFRRRRLVVDGDRIVAGMASPPWLVGLALVPLGAVVLSTMTAPFGVAALLVNGIVLQLSLDRRVQALIVTAAGLASYFAPAALLST